jgi:hypothetical protein
VTGSIPGAARIIGIDRSTAWRISKTAPFQNELRRRMDTGSGLSTPPLGGDRRRRARMFFEEIYPT